LTHKAITIKSNLDTIRRRAI